MTSDDDDEMDWILRLRITSSRFSLAWIEQQSEMVGGYGSFSKGDPIPVSLQSLEKASIYDESRLQITFELDAVSKLEKKIAAIVRRHSDQLRKVRDNGCDAIELEFSVEHYGLGIAYLTLPQSTIQACADLKFGFHFVI